MGWSIYCAQVVRIGFYLVHISSTKHNPMATLFVWRGFLGRDSEMAFSCQVDADTVDLLRKLIRGAGDLGRFLQKRGQSDSRWDSLWSGKVGKCINNLKVRNWEISLPEITEHVPMIVWTHGISIFAAAVVSLAWARVCVCIVYVYL